MAGEDKGKAQSIQRAKKTAVKLGIILGKKAVSLATGGLSADLSELLLDHVRQYQKDERDRRIAELFKNIFNGVPDAQAAEELMEKDIPLDDLYAVMNYAVQDEESEKVGYYSKLLKHLLKNDIERHQKLFILKLFRDLSAFDFLVLKKYYKFHVLGQRWRPEPLNGVTLISSPFPTYLQRFYTNSMRDPIRASSLKRLQGSNLLGDSNQGFPTPTVMLERIGQIVEFDINEGNLGDDL